MKKNTFIISTLMIIVIMFLTILQSCAVSGLSSEPIKFNKENSFNGLVVGSITFTNEKARFNSYFTYFHSLDHGNTDINSNELQISPHQTWKVRHSGELNNGKTYLFALEKTPGNYEVSYIRLASVGMGYAVRDNFINNFSIPFEVKKGEITYIGEIYLNEYALKNDTIIRLKNNFERDINALKIKQPTVNWDLAKESKSVIIYK